MKIIYDHREYRSINPYINDKFESATLAKGDYLIVSPAGVHAVVERKSITDFVASIKDGRYLNRHDFVGLSCPVYYIVEEIANSRKLSIPRETVYKASYNLSHRDGIFPIFTKNVKNTVEHLQYMASSLENVEPCRVCPDEYFYTSKISNPARESRKRILAGCPQFGDKTVERLKDYSIYQLYEGGILTKNKQAIFNQYLATRDAVSNIYRLTKKRAKKFMEEYSGGIPDYIEYGDDEYDIITKAIN